MSLVVETFASIIVETFSRNKNANQPSDSNERAEKCFTFDKTWIQFQYQRPMSLWHSQHAGFDSRTFDTWNMKIVEFIF